MNVNIKHDYHGDVIQMIDLDDYDHDDSLITTNLD